jgi:hypothetical protein
MGTLYGGRSSWNQEVVGRVEPPHIQFSGAVLRLNPTIDPTRHGWSFREVPVPDLCFAQSGGSTAIRFRRPADPSASHSIPASVLWIPFGVGQRHPRD